nr:hypothetical protein [Tanacetum cinerariifolium]
KTSVSRPQLKSNPQGDRVLRSNSRGKKFDVEEPRRNVKLLKNKMSVTASVSSQFKFLNSLSTEWSKFVTDIKLVKDYHTNNFDQLHAYLQQHELQINEVRIMDTVVLLAKRIKKLESKLKPQKRKLVLSDSENEEEERQSKELDALLDLANATIHEPSVSTPPSKPAQNTRARATTIIYKRLKKKQSFFGLDFRDAVIPAGGLDSAAGLDSTGGVDSAGGLTSAGISVAAAPTVPAEPLSPLRDPSKGKAVATPSSPVAALTTKELSDQQAAILEVERQELLEQEHKQGIDAEQVYLDSLLAQRRFYALLAIHVLETEAGDIMYMFVDKKYPLTPETLQRMLNHGLEIDRDLSGNDLTTAIQLIQSILNQLNHAA